MDRLELVLLAGALPALFMLCYATLKLRGGLLNPVLWAALLCGTGVCMPALAVEFLGMGLRNMLHLGPVASSAILNFGFVGPAEEGGKLLIVLALVELDGQQQARRALLATIGVGVGFALLENLYFLVHARDVVGLAIARANTALPVHLLLAMVLGSMVVRSRIYKHNAPLLLAMGFVLAAVLHGGYDFLLSNPFGNELISRRLIQFGGVVAIGAFSRVLPLAQAADEANGDAWPAPLRVACLCAGVLTLPWPAVSFVVALATHRPGATLIAVFPSLIVLDLLRSAFVRASPNDGHRRLLTYRPSW